MGKQDHLGAAVSELDDRRGVALDARNVGDRAVMHRNVQIDADEDALAPYISIVEGAKAHGRKLS